MSWGKLITIVLAVDAALTILGYWFVPSFREYVDEKLEEIRNLW